MSVIIVISGTFPHTYRVLYMTVNGGVFGECHASVTITVTQTMA